MKLPHIRPDFTKEKCLSPTGMGVNDIGYKPGTFQSMRRFSASLTTQHLGLDIDDPGMNIRRTPSANLVTMHNDTEEWCLLVDCQCMDFVAPRN
jgi:hypothetical protein